MFHGTIPDDIRLELREWALDLLAEGKLNPNNSHGTEVHHWRSRWLLDLSNEPVTIPESFYTLRDQCDGYAKELLGDKYQDKEFPWIRQFISIIEDGGAIHMHYDDQRPNGWAHIRINCSIQMPESGGHSIREDEIVVLTTGDIRSLQADRVCHGSTVVRGPNPRINISFGYFYEE